MVEVELMLMDDERRVVTRDAEEVNKKEREEIKRRRGALGLLGGNMRRADEDYFVTIPTLGESTIAVQEQDCTTM